MEKDIPWVFECLPGYWKKRQKAPTRWPRMLLGAPGLTTRNKKLLVSAPLCLLRLQPGRPKPKRRDGEPWP